MMKYFHCKQGKSFSIISNQTECFSYLDIAEYLLNNLCCLPFQINSIRPKYLTLIQIWFLLKKSRLELNKDLQIAQEQSEFVLFASYRSIFSVDLSDNLSNLISTNNYSQIALMLNRRTLNNNRILTRILDEYHFQIPGKSSFLSRENPHSI